MTLRRRPLIVVLPGNSFFYSFTRAWCHRACVLLRGHVLHWVALCIILLSSVAFADPEDNDYTLENLPLCLDASSVQIYADDVVVQHYPDLPKELFNTLMTNLKLTLQGSSVTLVFHDLASQSSCKDEAGYILSNLYLHYLDPSIYTEFNTATVSYALYVQVGKYAPKEYVLANYTLPQSHFIQFSEDVYTLQADTTVLEHLSQKTTTLVLQLAAAWWDDNPPKQRPYLPYVLGAFLTLGVVGTVLSVHKRRAFSPQRFWRQK
jgi:hypothetical protein